MIEVDDLAVSAGAFEMEGVSFTIPAGKYGVLMGRTGSGKTTVLEAVCGLKRVISGSIRLHGIEVSDKPPGARGVGFVPQEGSLFSTKTVRQHLEFGPAVMRWDAEATKERVEELAGELGIEDLLDRKPRGLSGGERQRVALGRALAVRPRVLCLDEPLSALDEETRSGLMALLKRVTTEHGITALHITHNPREAEAIGDVCFTVKEGQIVSAT